MAFFPEGAYNQALKEKYREPQHKLLYKDPSLPPDKMLEVDQAHLKAAKDREVMQPLKVRFIEEGNDRTLDDTTKFPKQCTITGMSAQETILELREAIAAQENLAVEDVNLFVRTTNFEDNMLIGDCFVDFMGFGLDEWPPRFIVKPKVKGFEVFCDVRGMRDTSVWENGRMQAYAERNLVFDCETSTTVRELKEMIQKKIGIFANRLKLTAMLRKSLREYGTYVDLDDDGKTLLDYEMHKYGVCVKVEKATFDAEGNYIFDDAYFDEAGYHPQPADCWLPQDSLADRSRPDAHKTDPTQPLSIVTDRRQAEATAKFEAAEAEGKA